MIFLVGHHAAGKSETAQILKMDYNFLHFETGEIVREYKRSHQPEIDTASWVKFVEDFNGPRYLDRVIAEYIKKGLEIKSYHYQEVLISGNRSVNGVAYLREQITGTPERVPLIVYVHASPAVLYRRFISRRRERDDATLTQSEFEIILRGEEEFGLANLHCVADKILDNDFTTKEELASAAQDLFEYQLGYRRTKES